LAPRFPHIKIVFALLFSFSVCAGKNTDSLEALLPKVSGIERLKVLSGLIDSYIRTDRPKAWQYFDQYEELFFQQNQPKEMQAYYWHSKGTKLGHDGDFEGSIAAYKNAEKVLLETKNYDFLWNLYNGFGASYTEHGDREKALFYFIKAFKIAEEHLGEGSVAGSAINLGVVYAETGDFKEALKYFVISKNYHQKTGEGWGYGNSLNNIGQVFMMTGNSDSAFYYYTKALTVWEQTRDENGLAMTHFNLGELSLEKGDYATAEAHMQMSLEISEKINEQYGITQNLVGLSSLYFKSGNNKKGLEYLEKAISFAKKNNLMKTLQESYDKLYRYYKKEGDFKNALWAHEDFFYWYDSLNNFEKNKNLQELYSKFETQKKQKEIEKQKAELAEEKNREILLWAVLGVVLAVAVVVFISRSQHKKKNKIITEKQKETDIQKKMLEEKNQSITSSIQYAQRIQHALLTGEESIKKYFRDYFIVYAPKDIVSGDFYWATEITNGNTAHLFVAVCDSTGHGVPGAFMSLLNISFLNQAVNEKNILNPAEVFDHVRKMLIDSIPDEETQDGMDGIIMNFTYEKNGGDTFDLKKFSYASGNSHVWLARKGFIAELKFDKMAIGKGPHETIPFTRQECILMKGDHVYCMSDGYADQFGGPQGKKFKYKNLKEFVAGNSIEDCSSQQKMLADNFNKWKGNLEQIDDVLVMGFKI
jgi:serine phosphatase RsbU (regulator of sigma subunit)